MDAPKTFNDLVAENTWLVMQGLAAGSKLSDLVRSVLNAALRWKRTQEDPQRAEDARQGMKDHISNLERECDRLKDELKLKDAEINGLKKAPEVIKTEMNVLIRQIAQQRDDAKKELEQAKANIEEKQAEVMKFAGDLVKEEEKHRLANEMAAELKRQRDEADESLRSVMAERDQLKADYTKLSALHQQTAEAVARDTEKLKDYNNIKAKLYKATNRLKQIQSLTEEN